MSWKGKMTRTRLERLKQEGLIGPQEAMSYEADLFMESKRISTLQKRQRAQKKEMAALALRDDEVREKLKYTDLDIAAMNKTIHKPGRHAMAVQSGLKLKAQINGLLDRADGIGGGLSVVVNTLGVDGRPRVLTLEAPSVSTPEQSATLSESGSGTVPADEKDN